MTLGAIISQLGKPELQAIWESDSEPCATYLSSINHLVKVIRGIKVIRLYDNHTSCNPVPGLIGEIWDLTECLGGILTTENLAHLEAKREKLGLSRN